MSFQGKSDDLAAQFAALRAELDAANAKAATEAAKAAAEAAARVAAESRAAAESAKVATAEAKAVKSEWRNVLHAAATFSAFLEAMTQRGDSSAKSLGRLKSWKNALADLRGRHAGVDASVIDERFEKYWSKASSATTSLVAKNGDKDLGKEADVVHPVGRLLVDAVARCAAELHGAKGALAQYNENATMSRSAVPSLNGSVLSRNPDGAVLVKRAGFDYERLDRQTQRDVVVSFEFKRKLEADGRNLARARCTWRRATRCFATMRTRCPMRCRCRALRYTTALASSAMVFGEFCLRVGVFSAASN